MTDQVETGIAINLQLAPQISTPPAMLMLIPPGLHVRGRDGRSWINSNPAGVVKFSMECGLKIPFDIEHASELKAPKGEAAPAMAWGLGLSAQSDGSIWARMDWTPKGAGMIMNREYSYYSPAIIYNKLTMEIIGIKSVGFTNSPNLSIPALNRENGTGGAPFMVSALRKEEVRICELTGVNPHDYIETRERERAEALNRAKPLSQQDEDRIFAMIGVTREDVEKESGNLALNATGGAALSDQELKICEMMGIDPHQYIQANAGRRVY